jgi:hypothetical protein
VQASRRVTVLCAAAVLVVALLAACSDDGDGVSTQGATTTTTSGPTTSAGCALTDASTDAKSGTSTADAVALLTAVRTGTQPCADRIVFEFRDGPPPAYSIEYEPGPFTHGESGQPLDVQGSAFLVVRFPHASGVDLSNPAATLTYTGPESIVPTGLVHVREVRRLEDFEAVLVWVIGVDGTRPFTVGTLEGPPRLYLDIG